MLAFYNILFVYLCSSKTFSFCNFKLVKTMTTNTLTYHLKKIKKSKLFFARSVGQFISQHKGNTSTITAGAVIKTITVNIAPVT